MKQNRHSTRQRRWFFLLLACLGVAAIVVVSFLPVAEKRSLHTRGTLHSPGHLIAFGLVAFLTARSVWSGRLRILLATVMVMVGFWVELGEHLTYRAAFEWKDVVLDVIGIIAGTLLAMVIEPKEA